jgi:phosphoribosylformylglycinamidine synthase
MAFAGGIGLDIKLKKVPKTDMREDHVMFSESNSRFIVEIDRKKANKFEEFMNGNVIACIGKTTKNKDLIIRGMSSNLIKSDLYTLKEAWQRTLR